MGIKGLSKLIAKEAPSSIRKVDIANYYGKVIAIDASIIMYQFLTTARDMASALSNDSGAETSHLSGVLYRTIRLLENGIKPVYVFDGIPPSEKHEELNRRAEASAKVKIQIEQAKADGDAKRVEVLSRRTVKVNQNHVKSCKNLLDLLGVPFVDASGEAEAHCASMVRQGIAHAVATEDMDALTFGANILIRHFSAPKQKEKEMTEFNLGTVLEEMKLDSCQFIDLCILLGCDYCETIKGLGPGTAIKMIRKFNDIETILTNVDKKKFTIPEKFPFQAARDIFKNPPTIDSPSSTIKWNNPDLEGLEAFLIQQNNFNETRVKNSIERLKTLKNQPKQSRIESFFAVKRKVNNQPTTKPSIKNKKKPN